MAEDILKKIVLNRLLLRPITLEIYYRNNLQIWVAMQTKKLQIEDQSENQQANS